MKETAHLTIKDLDEGDMPREKMLKYGKKQMSNSELLAILIGSGYTEVNAIELSKEILASAGNSLSNLSKMSPSELMRFKGIGEAKSVTIAASLELARRLHSEITRNKGNKICNSTDLFNYMADKLVDLPHEEFWAIYLNIQNKVLACTRISSGGITDTAVDIRLLFKGAIENNAVALSVAHNHPSGHLSPSRQDDQLTKSIKEAGNIMQIRLLDHIIIGHSENGIGDYYSYLDNGRL